MLPSDVVIFLCQRYQQEQAKTLALQAVLQRIKLRMHQAFAMLKVNVATLPPKVKRA